jgi:hypothetical protein
MPCFYVSFHYAIWLQTDGVCTSCSLLGISPCHLTANRGGLHILFTPRHFTMPSDCKQRGVCTSCSLLGISNPPASDVDLKLWPSSPWSSHGTPKWQKLVTSPSTLGNIDHSSQEVCFLGRSIWRTLIHQRVSFRIGPWHCTDACGRFLVWGPWMAAHLMHCWPGASSTFTGPHPVSSSCPSDLMTAHGPSYSSVST